jgi:hypothetical protein
MQGWGGINSPRPFGLGQADPGPALSSGPGLAQRRISVFLGRDRPNPFWAEIGPTFFGLSPAQLVGPDQPNPFNIIYLYIILFCIIYICIHVLKQKKTKK